MSSRRRSTVHDLAALRLHRDGSRVQNSDSNVRPRNAKYTARDARGNWFARDAGGLGNVKKRRAGLVHDADRAQEGEVFDLTGVDHGGDAASVSSKGKGRAEDSEEPELRRNPRAEKRRKFDEDFSFLTSAAGPSSGLVPHKRIDLHGSELRGVSVEGSFPNPSSDLLKCLHYFASSYYSATGQLVDAAREARHERKLRRLERRRQRIDAGIQSLRSDEEEHDSSTEEEDEQVQHEDDEEDNDDKEGTRARKIGRRRRSKESLYLRDMYKSFDGSALMAIGMLLQEHIARQLSPNIPDGWEAEMAAAGCAREIVDPKSHSEGRKEKDGEESEPEAESSDSGGSDDNELEARSSGRVTRGIVQQMSNLPYEDDDDDEDYVP